MAVGEEIRFQNEIYLSVWPDRLKQPIHDYIMDKSPLLYFHNMHVCARVALGLGGKFLACRRGWSTLR